MIVSSGLPQLIRPVLEREGLEVELRCNDAEPAARRLAAPLPGRRRRARSAATCASAARFPDGRPLVYVGDGISDRCAARAADRIFARGWLAGDLARRGHPARALRDPRRRCCCPFLSRTTSSSRPSASACSGPTSRTSGTTARSTGSSAGARCGSRRRRAASTSSRSTARRAPAVEKLLGLEFELEPFSGLGGGAARALRARRRGSRASGRRSRPTRSRASSPRSRRSRSRCFAAFAIRSRFIEQLGVRVGRAYAFPTRERVAAAEEASSSRSASRAGRPST